MAELESEFKRAAEDVKSLPKRPSNDELLKLYGLFKQATAGDASGERPGMLAVEARAKFDAWAKLTGLEADDAMQGYVKLVAKLKQQQGA
jgi:diazepam-binding inhibitor (GABA receptor modulating acyl-CoA-binding protein)